jgi:hypothetical protein
MRQGLSRRRSQLTRLSPPSLAAVDAGGEKLAKRIQRVFQVVNAGCDGELTFFEFQQAVASTDIFVQVCKVCSFKT